MDLLKAELERKRRGIAESSNKGTDRNGKRKKYLTAAQRRRFEEEEEDREEELRREKRRRRKKRTRRGGDDGSDEDDGKMEEDLTTLLTKKYNPAKRKNQSEAGADGGAASGKYTEEAARAEGHAGDTKEIMPGAGDGGIPESLRKLSPEEVTDTLRGYGLPIRLFGEQTTTIDGGSGYDDTARLQRLSIATKGREAAMLGESEKDEFLLESANRTRNVFLEKDAHNDNNSPADGGKTTTTTTAAPAAALTEEELNDKPKRIYRYFKSLVRQWEEDLAHRPESVKRTAAGKNETKTFKQCKDYIRPLFHQCKRRELADDLQTHLFRIVTCCEEGEFVKAHDSYIDVAIGRAAWPIGVTMVGIHARSGRAKIESANVAHVMNSESQRKYLTSVKRLMSYAQRKRPDVHPSKKVMNV
mmetsp:Transcript_16052/g.29019  ORF Transcript_16052/g.29019 Transcript_16052/m.29019 type:complete len:415 (-) Transcript_16052:313-1557(-)